MPETIFLTERSPLVFKAAKWLSALSSERPLDLSDCSVLVPTSGAGRRLRSEIVKLAIEEGRGLLAPLLSTPMGLLALTAGEQIASRADSLLAWTEEISGVSAMKFPLLLSGFSDHRNSALQIGQSLMEACSLLAEAGLTPLSPEIARATPHQEDRWQEVESLYRLYLGRLENAGLEDANAARIRAASSAVLPENVRRVIVAGVPDLNRISQRFLENLEATRVPVTVLVDTPACEGLQFDPWGRPDVETWSHKTLALRADDIVATAEPAAEAETVAHLIGPSGSAALCVADAKTVPFHTRAMHKQGLAAYDPAGTPLAPFESATLSRLWLSFSSSGRLSALRTLAEHPVFLQMLCRESHLRPASVLCALDELQTTVLVETLEDAVAIFEEGVPGRNATPLAATLVAAAAKLKKRFSDSGSLGQLSEFLRAAYAGREIPEGSGEEEALVALAGLLHGIRNSPFADPGINEGILYEEMNNVTVFERRKDQDVELNGWLEAAWLPHSALVISGCTEGALPARISANSLLPDSLRAGLGLQSNASRFARDLYLLHCMLAAREPGAVKLTLCRTGADGEPSKPSRLLFRCPDAELGSRVKRIFGPVDSLRMSHPREWSWPLKIPQSPPPSTLRVTAFGDYLKCPLRFYLKHVLGLRKFEPQKAEMSALDFGIVLHKTVENFAGEVSVRESMNADAIERFVLAELDVVLTERFGRRLSLPLRVQRESLRARLRRFARIQAQERRDGWRIHHGELRFDKEHTLALAGMPVVGSLDRVDIHEKTGQRRVLDYKTFAKRKSAADVHLTAGTGEHDFRETVCHGKRARWQDLQLPLYRALAEFLWPDDPQPPAVGYFLLPERIEESGIEEFVLDAPGFASAMSSAEAVANRIQRGIYWPPGAVPYDDYASIFLGDDPADILSEESKAFLMGAHDVKAA
jgi:ATP-dependent helicase/nuclease subunit B